MNVQVGLAAPEDDEAIRRLFRRQTMPGRVRLAFSRDPDFSRGCAVTGDNHRILVARAAGDIVGVACRSVRDVFLNGRECRIGCLGQLRVDDGFRGRWLVSRGFSALAQLDREQPLPAYLASIVDGNDEAAGVLVRKRRPAFPVFREVAQYRTLAIASRRVKGVVPGDHEITPASRADLPEVASFLCTQGTRRQLSTVWTTEKLHAIEMLGLHPGDIRIARRRGAIVGTMALWDQSAYKQSIIRGYSGWMRALAPVLPRVGSHVRSAYASLVSVADDDPVVFEGLLRAVYNMAALRQTAYLLIGLDARDPLLPSARKYRHYSYPSRLYLASWPNGGHTHEPLDARPAYVDIATL